MFQNVKNFIYCAECKRIHEKKTKIKIKPMSKEAIEKYTKSQIWGPTKLTNQQILAQLIKAIHYKGMQIQNKKTKKTFRLNVK